MKLWLRSFRVSLVVLALWRLSGHAQGRFLETITFDGPPLILPGTDIGVTYYYEDSMTFTPLSLGDQFGRMGGGRSGFPENGTAYLILDAFDSFSASRGSVSRFGLFSVNLAEFSTVYPFPQTVQFVGYKPDGTAVTTDFTTDGIIDGSGPLPDFQTFYFDERFADLVRFEAPTHTYALDNLVFFDVVPEPGTWTLLLLGGVLGCRFLKRQRKTVRN